MKSLKPITLTLVALCFAAISFAQTAVTTPAERKDLSKKVATTKKGVMALTKVSQEQWTFKPADGGWSIAEVCEHILIVESGIFGMTTAQVMTAGDGSKVEEFRKKDEPMWTGYQNRTKKAEAPSIAIPTGKYATPADFLKDYEAFIAQKEAFVKNQTNDLRAHFMKFPMGDLGEMDAYNYMVMSAAHTMRHIAQANEVKTEPTYPAK